MRHVVYLLLVANLVYLGWNLLPDEAVHDPFSRLPPVPDTASPLVTLKEMQQQSAASSPGGIDTLTESEPPSAGQPACNALGPFAIREQLQAVNARLDGLGMQPRERVVEVREDNGYWVYLPAMERVAALGIAGMLDEKGDSDYFIGRDNVISLGTFRNIRRAEVRLEQARKLGLDAILEARFRTHDSYWLEFRADPRAEQELSAILGEHPQLELHELSCL